MIPVRAQTMFVDLIAMLWRGTLPEKCFPFADRSRLKSLLGLKYLMAPCMVKKIPNISQNAGASE